MKVSDKWKEMVTASERVIENFNDFADDRATVWADNQIKQLTAERDEARAVCDELRENNRRLADELALTKQLYQNEADICDTYQAELAAIK